MNTAKLQRYFDKREKAVVEIRLLSREIVRHSAKSILLSLNHKFDKALNEFLMAKKKFNKLAKLDDKQFNVEGEVAEAYIVFHALRDNKLVDNSGFTPEAYVYGLLDAVGEFKRAIFDYIRKGDYEKANTLFNISKKIYNLLFPMNISRAVLPDFKRKLDVVRIQLDQIDLALLGPR